MSRPRRVEVPGGYYHVVTRGNDRQVVFDEALRPTFLAQLAQIAKTYDWEVYAWALMSTHYHLVIRIGDRGLSSPMRDLNTRFARASNARFGRINHCFGERFWSAQLQTDGHLFASVRYTLWNPVRAGVAHDPLETDWTSFGLTVGLRWPHRALARARLLEHFGSNPSQAERAFRRFVDEGRERCLRPWKDETAQLR